VVTNLLSMNIFTTYFIVTLLCDNSVTIKRDCGIGISQVWWVWKVYWTAICQLSPFPQIPQLPILRRGEREFTAIVPPIVPAYDLFTAQWLACYHNQRPITAVPKKTKKKVYLPSLNYVQIPLCKFLSVGLMTPIPPVVEVRGIPRTFQELIATTQPNRPIPIEPPLCAYSPPSLLLPLRWSDSDPPHFNRVTFLVWTCVSSSSLPSGKRLGSTERDWGWADSCLKVFNPLTPLPIS